MAGRGNSERDPSSSLARYLKEGGVFEFLHSYPAIRSDLSMTQLSSVHPVRDEVW